MSDFSTRAKLTTEFIGTLFLTLAICTAAVLGTAGALAPFAIASTLMVMIYAGGHISGAHYNPAVTLSIYLRGACKKSDLAPYIATQLVAGTTGAIIAVNMLVPEGNVEQIVLETGPAFTAELLFTFALAYVILNVATSESTEGNGFYGAAIALVVLAGALSVGSISGASFNPAVTVALIASGTLGVEDSWIHFIPQVVGGCLAALVFKAQRV
ncbi:MAG: porin [Euryarchaeota archaeon TMED192]|nr:MAG: porin [Euryarchaeota archaeon TMED192]|tara:strand:- start:2206 stop:2844 length:639 start_codon:yes stop_codon:yes gene_type:complete